MPTELCCRRAWFLGLKHLESSQSPWLHAQWSRILESVCKVMFLEKYFPQICNLLLNSSPNQHFSTHLESLELSKWNCQGSSHPEKKLHLKYLLVFPQLIKIKRSAWPAWHPSSYVHTPSLCIMWMKWTGFQWLRLSAEKFHWHVCNNNYLHRACTGRNYL